MNMINRYILIRHDVTNRHAEGLIKEVQKAAAKK